MVEAKIRGAQDSPAITQNYETIVLKPHVVNGVNVISQQDVAGNNKKFVIKWGFTLTENLVFGVGCILDFDGGFFTNDEAHNYTITGNNTRVILNTDEAACLKGVYKGGTWLYPEFPLSPDEFTRDDDVIVIGEQAVDTGNLKDKALTDDKMDDESITRRAISRNPENSIADNEDLTVNENGQLQLADKEYDAEHFSGLGRVYLRKNIVQRPNVASGSWITYAVDGITYLLYWYNNVLYNCHKIDNYGLVVVNHIAVESADYDVEALPDYAQLNSLTYTESGGTITITLPNGTTIAASSIYDVTLYSYEDNVDDINMLTDDMIQEEATIYIIQYDYTLGKNITIPENCVIEFAGGSISGGTIDSAGNTRIIGYGNKCALGTSANNFVFDSPVYVDPLISSDSNSDGSVNNPYKTLNTACARCNWIALKRGSTYTVGCAGWNGIMLEIQHHLTLECLDGMATISGKVTLGGTSNIVSNKNNVTLSSITDEAGNTLNYSEDKKLLFDFGYIYDGNFIYRRKVKDITTVGDRCWSDAAQGGTSFSLPLIVIGEGAWYSKTGSVGGYCLFMRNRSKLTIRNIEIRDFGKHAIGGNGNIYAENCSFRNIGGSYQNIAIATTFGNGIEVYPDTDNGYELTAKNCSFINIYDAGLTIQGPKGWGYMTVDSCYFAGCMYGIEYFQQTNGIDHPVNGKITAMIRNNVFDKCSRAAYLWGDRYFRNYDADVATPHCAIQMWHQSEGNFWVINNTFIDCPMVGTVDDVRPFKAMFNRLIYTKANSIVVSWAHSKNDLNHLVTMVGVNVSKALTDLNNKLLGSRENAIVANDFNPHVGTTSERPSLQASDVGFYYFDNTISKPIWYTGSGWVDATGTTV